jgi:Ca-activated chloride channel family protein
MRHPQLLIAALVLLAASVPARAAGLLAPNDRSLPPLRITDHLVDVTVHDQVAITTVRQTFHNDTDRRLEATYVFPLPEEGDLTDFQMSFNGKMAQGRVLPKEEARRIYESIVRQAKDPGLIEFIGRRLLQMRVFPIEPRSDVTVQVRYQQICTPVSGMNGYHYPLRTGLETTAPLKTLWSPTHSVEIVRQGEHKAQVAYEATGASLDDDFLLLYATDSSDLGLSVVAYAADPKQPGHFVLTLTPRQLWPEDGRQPQDVVFVLDTSGSMASDQKLEQAKAALSYCVSQLDEADRFSVVRFSTGFDVLYDPVVPATNEHRAKAQEWIGQFRAQGGTNIADTLAEATRLRDGDGRPFVIVFLTDGQGNRPPDEIMRVVEESAKGREGALRVFPFGVGHDVNTVLLDRLANGYRGRPMYVQPGEDLELVLGDFFSVVSQPVLTNLKLVLPGEIGVTERFPAVLGDLYHGQQLTIAGRFARGTVGPVTLRATRSGKAVEYVWPEVAFVHTPEATYVPPIWAGRKIAYLVDQIRLHGESEEMVKEILALSQEYGIQTPYSSWLVDPERTQVAWRGGVGGGGGAPAADRGVDLFQTTETMSRQRQFLGRYLRSAPASGEAPRSAGATPGPEAVQLEVGQAATTLATQNAELRERLTADAERLSQRRLARQRIGDRWYNLLGGFLVDERVEASTAITAVRFASEAYFELVDRREDLRPALARGRNVVVLVAEGRALLIADDEGIETMDEDLRKVVGTVPAGGG